MQKLKRQIYGDHKLVLNLIPIYVSHWSIAEVIADILDFVKCFDAISFSFMYREGNVQVHLLAQ